MLSILAIALVQIIVNIQYLHQYPSSEFGKTFPYVQCKLFKQYCCSCYGTPLCSFNSYHKVCIPWRKALRKIWKVSYMTHCKIISMLSECFPLELCLKLRFCKFVKGILLKGSNLIKHISKCI